MAAARLGLSVLVLLLAAIALSEGLRGNGPKKCCQNFRENPPVSRVVSFKKTSQQCRIPGVRLQTETGRVVCAKSSAPWVKEIIRNLDNKPGQASNV